jgi:hypothetical protein
MARDLLSDASVKQRGYVKPAYVRWLLDEHESGRRNFSDQLYALIVLEVWHQGLHTGSYNKAQAAANS